MGQPANLIKATQLRRLAIELETLADAVELPSRSHERSDNLIGDGERIARAVWSVFRGGL